LTGFEGDKRFVRHVASGSSFNSRNRKTSVFDLNLGYIATVDFSKIFNISIGVQCIKVLSLPNSNVTSPHQDDNAYFEKCGLRFHKKDHITGDTWHIIRCWFLKLMARASFDPNGFLRHPKVDWDLG